jgi:hypothetical protein
MKSAWLKPLLGLSLLCGSAAFTPVMAAGDDFQEKMVVQNASPEFIETLLTKLNLDYTKVRDNAYRFQVKGYKVVLFNKGEDMQLYAGFSKSGVTLARINSWNKGKRFTRAYLDDENDPVLESDLNLEGGVSAENLLRFIAIFNQSLEVFIEHIKE